MLVSTCGSMGPRATSYGYRNLKAQVKNTSCVLCGCNDLTPMELRTGQFILIIFLSVEVAPWLF